MLTALVTFAFLTGVFVGTTSLLGILLHFDQKFEEKTIEKLATNAMKIAEENRSTSIDVRL